MCEDEADLFVLVGDGNVAEKVQRVIEAGCREDWFSLRDSGMGLEG